MSNPSDQVIDRCARGDVRALGEIYQLLGGRIWRLCQHLLRDDSEAEDAVQEIFLKVFDRIGQWRRRGQFSTWLYRVAVNHCAHLRESRALRAAGVQREASNLTPAAERSPLEQNEEREDGELVREWVDRLDERSREMILLREVEGLEYREIAAVLDVPIGTVMSGLSRARARLRRLAEARLVDEGTRG